MSKRPPTPLSEDSLKRARHDEDPLNGSKLPKEMGATTLLDHEEPTVVDEVTRTEDLNQDDYYIGQSMMDSKPLDVYDFQGVPENDSAVGGRADSFVADSVLGGSAVEEVRNGEKGPDQSNEEEMDETQTNVAAVQLLLMEAVEELSVVSRTLERWPVYNPPIGVDEDQPQEVAKRQRHDEAVKKGHSRISEHIRRFIRKSRKLMEALKETKAFDGASIPVDMMKHIDHYLSPNTWLRALYDEVDYENAVGRGELEALGAAHATLQFYMRINNDLHRNGLVVVPDFSEASLPPTALRQPVRYSEKQLDLMNVLALLRKPIKPVKLGESFRV